ncbi:c-type cytochrome [Chelatococcus reniformis]|uniref:Cytochrome c n=1 Tax=Chelatococcus reniformis TaxID=1494448 RepID=A0A916UVI4_9HYPH|nr:c-type cytochrome [Chelatococcus reniformis]GGC88757.1 cytochrome c [Chelatococcus reniformis]
MVQQTVALLVVMALAGASSESVAQAAPDGEQLFRSRCGSCHALEPGPGRIGPPLAGVFGRKAAVVEGARYSAAMRGSQLTWDEQTLESYLANPRQAVPGTTMTVGLADAGQRQAVIAYLRGLPSAH